jgi:hypothetical protein
VYTAADNLPGHQKGAAILVSRSLPALIKVSVDNDPLARCRLLAVDIRFPTLFGHMTTIRVIGVYAPSSMRNIRVLAPRLRLFWQAVAETTRTSHHWILAGDFNASLNTGKQPA